MPALLKTVIKRLAISVPVLLCVAFVAFSLIHVVPGGPFDEERQVPAEVRKELEAQYNLDKPFLTQFGIYIWNVVSKGDLGPSFRYPGRTVQELIAESFPVSAQLGFLSLLFALFFGMAAGVYASLNHNRVQDMAVTTAALLGICLPTFLLGPILSLVFAVYLGWLPVGGWGQNSFDWLLPTITLGAAYTAYVARLMRSGMLEVLEKEFVRTARAKGLPEWKVVAFHVFPNALIPVVAFLGPALAGLMTGSFVVETVFNIPGLGKYFVQATFNRDYTLILGSTLFYSTLIIMFNFISDLLILWLNPKERTSNG